jgi:hypothetical protein
MIYGIVDNSRLKSRTPTPPEVWFVKPNFKRRFRVSGVRRKPSQTPKFQLGVLLVHGIGTQRPGDTLVRWGDVLLKTIERATRKEGKEGKEGVVAIVERAGPGDGPGKGRFEAEVLLRADDRNEPERWLLSECWWADAFPAPSYRELVSWSVRGWSPFP